MSFVAEGLGVDVYPIPQLHREISPVYDSLAVWRLVKLLRSNRPAHPAHAHGQGRRRRTSGGAARRRRASSRHRSHVPRPRPARLLRPAQDSSLPRARALAGDDHDATRRGRAAGTRRPRCSFTSRLLRPVPASSASASTSTSGSPRTATTEPVCASSSGSPRLVRRRVDRPDDLDQAGAGHPAHVQAPARPRCRRNALPRRRRPRPPARGAAGTRARDLPAHALYRLPARRGPVLRVLRRTAAPVCKRRDARGRDRGARLEPADRGDSRRRRARRRH